MESVPALSWYSSVLGAKELSRDAMSSSGAQLRRPELSRDSSGVSPALDTGGQAQLPPAPRLLTAREVAEQLSVSNETILRWTRCGELPAIRFPGGALRFREDALDAWLTKRATPGGELSTVP